MSESLPFDPATRHTRKQFAWVPDGIYDHSGYQVRYKIVQGFVMLVVSRMWIENGGPKDVDTSMKLPWGTYSDIPPKPSK